MSSELTCKELIEFLDDYVSGAQTSEVRVAFEEHLAICPECVDYLAQYRAAPRLARAALDGGAPAAPEDLIQAILNSRR